MRRYECAVWDGYRDHMTNGLRRRKLSFDPRLNVARSAWPRPSGVRRRRWRCLRAGTIWCACMFSPYSPPRRTFSSTEGLQAWVAPRKGTSFTTGAGGWSLGGEGVWFSRWSDQFVKTWITTESLWRFSQVLGSISNWRRLTCYAPC